MVYIAWANTLIASFGLGYWLRSLTAKIQVLEVKLKQKVDKPKDPEPASTLIDPLDAVAEAQYAQRILMERLNSND